MTLEIGATQIFGFLLTLLCTVFGIWLRRLHGQMDSLREAQVALREQVVREASTYVSRSELQACMHRIEAKLDRLADKLEGKQDKT